jgi:PhzF family phenazine biosynthesis protein
MSFPIYYVDAFTDKLFSGNPAAVIFSDLDNTSTMQKIAAENNLSETAFIKKYNGKYYIRWFAPSCEIDLCGHATLASAYVYFNFINPGSTELEVHSKKNGALKVVLKNDLLFLDFPKDSIAPADEKLVEKIIGNKPLETYQGRDDILAIVSSEKIIRDLKIDFDLLKKINVTGSAHTTLTPYWSKKLNKKDLYATQLSKRGGVLYCKDKDKRIIIGGQAVLYLKGEIYI